MASTQEQPKDLPTTDEKKAAERQQQAEKQKSPKEQLADEIKAFYGVEFDGKDYDKLIVAANKVAVERPTSYRVGDPVEEARMSEKLGRLRDMVERDASEGKQTEQQKNLQQYLDDANVEGIGLSFPNADSFRITSGGKEDTGNIDVTKEAFLQAISRIKGGAQL
jgi:hypothetical protein